MGFAFRTARYREWISWRMNDLSEGSVCTIRRARWFLYYTCGYGFDGSNWRVSYMQSEALLSNDDFHLSCLHFHYPLCIPQISHKKNVLFWTIGLFLHRLLNDPCHMKSTKYLFMEFIRRNPQVKHFDFLFGNTR